MAEKMKYYFGAETAALLASKLGLDPDEYANWVTPRVDDIEIKDRVRVFAQGLQDRLPADYLEALDVIVNSFGPELAIGEGYFNYGFYWWPVGQFIEDYGLEYPKQSLAAIEALTKVFTGEWAVRPYLDRYPGLTMQHVQQWVQSNSHNVRRLASEGIRPRLPWAKAYRPFMVDPSPIIPVLDQLFTDPTKYVRTSVANNLNDVSRTHPDLAIETVSRWLSADNSPETKWIARRALRTLLRQDNLAALQLTVN